jgi:hypothetical protein
MADEAAVILPKLTKGTSTGLNGELGFTGWNPVYEYEEEIPSLPALTGAATGASGRVSSIEPTLPMLTIGAGGDNGLWLPSLEVTASGKTGDAGSPDLLLPMFAVVGSGKTGATGSAATRLPALLADARGISGAQLLLPALTVSATGKTGGLGFAGVAALPALVASAAGITVNRGDADLVLPPLRVAASGPATSTGRLSALLPALALAAAGRSGTVGTSADTLPIFLVSAAGRGPAIGTATLVLPSLTLWSNGYGAPSAVPTAYTTLNLNTLNRALTLYEGWQFNSMVEFDGAYLAASADGIFKLEGDTDAGVLIDAAARLGVTDFGDPNVKKIDQAYFGYRAEGDLKLVIITDEHDVHEYRLESTGHEGVHNARAKLGKGMRGRYYQVGFENENGGDFRIDQGELRAVALKRRLA